MTEAEYLEAIRDRLQSWLPAEGDPATVSVEGGFPQAQVVVQYGDRGYAYDVWDADVGLNPPVERSHEWESPEEMCKWFHLWWRRP